MARVAPFHSINESRKGAPRYHTNDHCIHALAIPRDDWRTGSGGYYLCERCLELRARPALDENATEPVEIAEAAF